MKGRKLLQRICYMALIVLFLSGGHKIEAQPMSGDWRVSTGFGEFTITVNSAGTHITKLKVTFSSFNCGNVTQNGSISSQSSPGWSISNNKFSIQMSINPERTNTMTIKGTFTQTGDQISGTWSASVYGSICSGDWGPIMVFVQERGGKTPEQFELAQNHPNPFNSKTTIQFSLPKTVHVSIKIYSVLGLEVATLVDTQLPAGQYNTIWNAQGFATGEYLYVIHADDFIETKKLLLLE